MIVGAQPAIQISTLAYEIKRVYVLNAKQRCPIQPLLKRSELGRVTLMSGDKFNALSLKKLLLAAEVDLVAAAGVQSMLEAVKVACVNGKLKMGLPMQLYRMV